jgi:D-3-phosphoglycerate dehydrogenase
VLVYEKLHAGTFIVDELTKSGFDVDLPFGPDSTLLRHSPLSEEAFIDLAQGYDAVLGVSGTKLNERVFAALPTIKYVSKIGIGHDVIDLDAASRFGVAVTNTPSQVEIDAVAEHAITLLLAAAKRLDFYTPERMRSGQWLDPAVHSTSIRDSVLGIVGFGRIGKAVARRLGAWGVEVIATDMSPTAADDTPAVTLVELDELLTRADFISVHVSTSAGSRPILDTTKIALMKPGAILVNTARGASIDQEALREALESGRIAVAALDVFEPEPPAADDPLLRRPNLLVTPHSAANVFEAEHDMERMAVENLIQMLRGETPESLLTRQGV